MKPYPELKEIRAAACGNWHGIHASLGIPAHLLDTHKHQSCPACGGKDRFRYTDFQGNGGFICNQCTPQGGSGFDLLMLVLGLNFNESVKEVARLLGMVRDQTAKQHTPRPAPAFKPVAQPIDRQAELLHRFQVARPLDANGIAAAYLKGRGLPIDYLPAPIHETAADYWVKDIYNQPLTIGKFQCMVSAITLPDGELQGLHYTYLAHNGTNWQKFDFPHPQTREALPAKKMYTRFHGSLKGAAVHLEHADSQGRLLVAEGIETALAARALFGLPAIAALSANGMRSLHIPPDVRELYICADNDHSRTGFLAAHDLAIRAIKKGITAQLWQPETVGFDALDEYNARNNQQTHYPQTH